jgi:predicted dehydrogenase
LNKIKIGIIGTGSMGKNHLRVVNSISEFELTAAADVNSENIREACQHYHIKEFSDYRHLTEWVDCIGIATPTESHYEIAKYFILAGKHVMVEKPFTFNLDQANELIELATEKKVILAVGHLERFNPAIVYANQLITKPLFIESQRLGSFSPRSLDVDVILDLMIHDLDIILQWDHSEIVQLSGVGVPIISSKIDIANVRLEFASGLVANITASRVSNVRTRKLRVFQKNNYISLDYKKQQVKTYQLIQGEIIESIPEIITQEPLMNLWQNFSQSIRTKVNRCVSGIEGKNALKLAIIIADNIQKKIAS